MKCLRPVRVPEPGRILQSRYIRLYSTRAVPSIVESEAPSSTGRPARRRALLESYKQYINPAPTTPTHLSDPTRHAENGDVVTVNGFVGRRKRGGDASLTLLPFTTATGIIIQAASTSAEMLETIKAIPAFSPVRATGTVRFKPHSDSEWSLQLQTVNALNRFPSEIIVDKGVNFKPSDRHLQIRFHRHVQTRLRLRSSLKRALSNHATDLGYVEIETPLLFKSTADGAKEFIVPTRRAGEAYALAQSPQQYKQVLMSAGIDRYMQFARCFRDESLRSDRQQEFTQLDLERSFATGDDILRDVEHILSRTWDKISAEFNPELSELFGLSSARGNDALVPALRPPFRRLTYQECMDKYGSDKPDLRIPGTVFRFRDNDPINSFLRMTTPLVSPIMEASRLPNSQGCDPKTVRASVHQFMERLHPAFTKNPHGAPQIIVVDPALPLHGFSSLGFDGWNSLTTGPEAEAAGMDQLVPGDLVIFQARDQSHPGSGTRLGQLRSQAWAEIVGRQSPDNARQLEILWVVNFPMFVPDDNAAGAAGISPSHHLFTAPKTAQDAELLFSSPLDAIADNYDLVINGLEVGGGSRRIHVAEVQEFVMRDVLHLSEQRISEFAHLLRALRAGCPPHAGFAFGFDRLCALLTGTSSVRDVIAFPKSMRGYEPFANAPAKISNEQLAPYHVRLIEAGEQ